MDIQADQIKKLVEQGSVTMTQPTQFTPSARAVDGPAMGNGDMGAVIRTETDGYAFLLGKNDFWRQPQLYETPQQRQERLLGGNCRRTGGRVIPAGWLRIKIAGLTQNTYHMQQSIYDACIRIHIPWHGGALKLCCWICAQQNTLVVQLQNTAGQQAELDLSMMPGEYGNGEVPGYEDGYAADAVWFTYGAEPYNVPGRRIVGAAAAVSAPLRLDWNRMARKGGQFTLSAGGTAVLCLALLSDLDAEDPKGQALQQAADALGDVPRLWERHTQWWKAFWEKSAVETGDAALDSYYYSSLYWLGSCTRDGKVPPGLYGCWTASDLAPWSGAYTLNYNYQSPFFCLYTGNRQELASSYIEPLLDIMPIGEMYAREKFGRKGICLPVEIGPFGTVCCGLFHHQKTNAAYCCVNIFMHFFSTYDETWGRKAYPFVQKAAEFWEDDLVYENGVYNIVGDAAHEEVLSEGEKNNIHALGLVKMLFGGILSMSKALGLDAHKRDKWAHILAHLPEFPYFVRNGQEVFCYSKEGYAWKDGNGTPVKFIYPFGCIGLDSDEKTLERARNTLEQKDYLFYNANAYCEYVQMRARVGCDPEKTYRAMIKGCAISYPNRYMTAHGGGVEDFSAIPAGIHEMMLQSHEGVIRIFPCWPREKDAWFTRLRAYGAFLVSAQREGGAIRYVEVVSEKGKTLTVQNPWDCARVTVNGKEMAPCRESRLHLATQPGDTIVLQPAACGHEGN